MTWRQLPNIPRNQWSLPSLFSRTLKATVPTTNHFRSCRGRAERQANGALRNISAFNGCLQYSQKMASRGNFYNGISIPLRADLMQTENLFLRIDNAIVTTVRSFESQNQILVLYKLGGRGQRSGQCWVWRPKADDKFRYLLTIVP